MKYNSKLKVISIFLISFLFSFYTVSCSSNIEDIKNGDWKEIIYKNQKFNIFDQNEKIQVNQYIKYEYNACINTNKLFDAIINDNNNNIKLFNEYNSFWNIFYLFNMYKAIDNKIDNNSDDLIINDKKNNKDINKDDILSIVSDLSKTNNLNIKDSIFNLKYDDYFNNSILLKNKIWNIFNNNDTKNKDDLYENTDLKIYLHSNPVVKYSMNQKLINISYYLDTLFEYKNNENNKNLDNFKYYYLQKKQMDKIELNFSLMKKSDWDKYHNKIHNNNEKKNKKIDKIIEFKIFLFI